MILRPASSWSLVASRCILATSRTSMNQSGPTGWPTSQFVNRLIKMSNDPGMSSRVETYSTFKVQRRRVTFIYRLLRLGHTS